jgi:putative lipoic acid-binding regulatory protein
MINLDEHILDLDYPCNWKYKLITKCDVEIKHIMNDTLGKREHNVAKSNTSKKGKFTSYEVELIVHNEDDRKELHRIFHKHNDVKMIV